MVVDTYDKLCASFYELGMENGALDAEDALHIGTTCESVAAHYRDLIDQECAECRIPEALRPGVIACFCSGYLDWQA